MAEWCRCRRWWSLAHVIQPPITLRSQKLELLGDEPPYSAIKLDTLADSSVFAFEALPVHAFEQTHFPLAFKAISSFILVSFIGSILKADATSFGSKLSFSFLFGTNSFFLTFPLSPLYFSLKWSYYFHSLHEHWNHRSLLSTAVILRS